jgi:hypothetical protein
MRKISWADRVRNQGILCSVMEERNMLHVITRRTGNLIDHVSKRGTSIDISDGNRRKKT